MRLGRDLDESSVLDQDKRGKNTTLGADKKFQFSAPLWEKYEWELPYCGTHITTLEL